MKIYRLAILLLTGTSAVACAQTSQLPKIEAVIDGWSSRANTRVAILKLSNDPVPVLVTIAKSKDEPETRRSHAIALLATFNTVQSDHGLTEIADDVDPRYRCFALQSLAELKASDSVAILVKKLDDHVVCMKTISTDPPEVYEVYVSDEAVRLLEQVTGRSYGNAQHFGGHKATQPWKEWWKGRQKSSSNGKQKKLISLSTKA